VKENQIERRKYKRYISRKGTFAVLTPGFKNLGPIKDISQGGLALRYVDNGEPLSRAFKMDIFLTRKIFYLKDIPFKTISLIDEVSKSPFSSLHMKQRSVQFEKMDSDQSDQLNYFLSNHTVKECSRRDRRVLDGAFYKGLERRAGTERRKSRLYG
jgi:hypothetical protein